MTKKWAITCNGSESSNLFPTFILGSTAVSLGHDLVVFFTPSGAKALIKGELEKIEKEGMPNLVELYDSVIELGGKIILCELAFDANKDMKIEDLRDGVDVHGATTFASMIDD